MKYYVLSTILNDTNKTIRIQITACLTDEERATLNKCNLLRDSETTHYKFTEIDEIEFTALCSIFEKTDYIYESEM